MPGRSKRTTAAGRPQRVARDLHDLVEAFCAPVDDSFLLHLAVRLAAILKVEFVELAELRPGSDSLARTLVLLAHGQQTANVEYALRNTPGERVIDRGFCCFASGVQEAFPQDHMLAGMGAHGYAGAPLVDSFGRILGWIAVLDSRPLSDAGRVEPILRLFACRAAVELERERADKLFLNSVLERVGAAPAASVTTDSFGPKAV